MSDPLVGPAPSSSAPASSATASSTTWPGWAGATSCRSTRARCPTRAAPPGTRPTSSSRSTTPARSPTSPLDSVRQYQEMGVFTESGGFEVARTEERMEELRRRMSSARAWGIDVRAGDAGAGRRAGAVPRPGGDPRRVLDPVGRGRRLAARRHASCASGPRSSARCRSSPPSRSSASTSSSGRIAGVRTERRRHRGRHRRHRLRRVEPHARRDGRRADPADPGGAPDDQRRPDPAARRHGPARSRSRSSATWTPSATSASTAATWRSAPTRTGRSCTTPETIPSIEQASCRRPRCRSPPTTSTRSSSRRFELMPDALGAERRRDPLRDQRPAVADA